MNSGDGAVSVLHEYSSPTNAADVKARFNSPASRIFLLLISEEGYN